MAETHNMQARTETAAARGADYTDGLNALIRAQITSGRPEDAGDNALAMFAALQIVTDQLRLALIMGGSVPFIDASQLVREVLDERDRRAGNARVAAADGEA